MKRQHRFLLLVFAIVFSVLSCQKSEIPPPPPDLFRPCDSRLELVPITDTCFEPLPNTIFGFPPYYWEQEELFRYPAFDPSSFEKFLFFYETENENLPVFSPIKGGNFCTGEIWTINDSIQFTTSLSSLPKWSPKNWILMVRKEVSSVERGLYKIKPNGDSLSFLLNEEVVSPIWINGGDLILTRISGQNQVSFFLDENGSFLDTINYAFSYPSFYQEKIAARRVTMPDIVEIVVFENGEITWSYPYQEDFFNFRGLDWLNEEEIVWINESGIYRANTATNHVELVKEVCPNIYYSSISAARDGSNRLLLTRRDYLFENGITDSMSKRINVVLYELDTGVEYYVKLGEM